VKAMILQIQMKGIIFLLTLFLTLAAVALVWCYMSDTLSSTRSGIANMAVLSLMTALLAVAVFAGLRVSVLAHHEDLASPVACGLLAGVILAEAYLVFTVFGSS
jgi:hypothetical protein